MSDYQSIGFTKKTYGVKGMLKLNIQGNYLEDFAHAEVLFLGIDGRKIPFFIESINFEEPFTIKFEEYDSREAAVELAGKEIFLKMKDLIPNEEKLYPEITETALAFEPYIGFEVHDQTLGKIGTIEEIIEFPQQEMAVIFKDEKEVLIPLNEQLIQQIDETKKLILMDLPEGLLDI